MASGKLFPKRFRTILTIKHHGQRQQQGQPALLQGPVPHRVAPQRVAQQHLHQTKTLFTTHWENYISDIYLISLLLTSSLFMFWCKEFWIITLIILLIVYILGKLKPLILDGAKMNGEFQGGPHLCLHYAEKCLSPRQWIWVLPKILQNFSKKNPELFQNTHTGGKEHEDGHKPEPDLEAREGRGLRLELRGEKGTAFGTAGKKGLRLELRGKRRLRLELRANFIYFKSIKKYIYIVCLYLFKIFYLFNKLTYTCIWQMYIVFTHMYMTNYLLCLFVK